MMKAGMKLDSLRDTLNIDGIIVHWRHVKVERTHEMIESLQNFIQASNFSIC